MRNSLISISPPHTGIQRKKAPIRGRKFLPCKCASAMTTRQTAVSIPNTIIARVKKLNSIIRCKASIILSADFEAIRPAEIIANTAAGIFLARMYIGEVFLSKAIKTMLITNINSTAATARYDGMVLSEENKIPNFCSTITTTEMSVSGINGIQHIFDFIICSFLF